MADTKNMFNANMEMIRKQCNAGIMHCDNNAPIRRGETLEPCIRGAKKISAEPEVKQLVKEILVGRNK